MKTKINLALLLFAFLSASCEDIIEEDISDDNITVTYPLNDTQIESNVVTFQWNALDGADDYRIQVYASSHNMVLDSLVDKNTFTYPLAPGSYQWRVRGENFAYETAYTFPLSFTVTETDDLTNQQVQLLYPATGLYTQDAALTFSWGSVNAAEHYVFQLINVTGGNILLHQEDNISGTTYSLDPELTSQDAQYAWKVKAVNTENGSETQFASRNFYIDTTAPNQPQNTTPENESEDVVDEPIQFNWNAAADAGPVSSPLTYTIQIATDQGFSSIVNTATTSNTTYQYTFTTDDTYYWRVRATDQAGNQGTYSTPFEIVINQE